MIVNVVKVVKVVRQTNKQVVLLLVKPQSHHQQAQVQRQHRQVVPVPQAANKPARKHHLRAEAERQVEKHLVRCRQPHHQSQNSLNSHNLFKSLQVLKVVSRVPPVKYLVKLEPHRQVHSKLVVLLPQLQLVELHLSRHPQDNPLVQNLPADTVLRRLPVVNKVLVDDAHLLLLRHYRRGNQHTPNSTKTLTHIDAT